MVIAAALVAAADLEAAEARAPAVVSAVVLAPAAALAVVLAPAAVSEALAPALADRAPVSEVRAPALADRAPHTARTGRDGDVAGIVRPRPAATIAVAASAACCPYLGRSRPSRRPSCC